MRNIKRGEYYEVADGAWIGKIEPTEPLEDFMRECTDLGIGLGFRRDGKLMVTSTRYNIHRIWRTDLGFNCYAYFEAIRTVHDAWDAANRARFELDGEPYEKDLPIIPGFSEQAVGLMIACFFESPINQDEENEVLLEA